MQNDKLMQMTYIKWHTFGFNRQSDLVDILSAPSAPQYIVH